VSDHGVACSGGIVNVALVVRMLSGHDMFVVGLGGAPVLCLLGEGRPILPSLFKAVRNSSMESLITAWNGDGGPMWAERMMMSFEPSHMEERLRPLKSSVMTSRLPMQMESWKLWYLYWILRMVNHFYKVMLIPS
jgi:hypothetical protein